MHAEVVRVTADSARAKTRRALDCAQGNVWCMAVPFCGASTKPEESTSATRHGIHVRPGPGSPRQQSTADEQLPRTTRHRPHPARHQGAPRPREEHCRSSLPDLLHTSAEALRSVRPDQARRGPGSRLGCAGAHRSGGLECPSACPHRSSRTWVPSSRLVGRVSPRGRRSVDSPWRPFSCALMGRTSAIPAILRRRTERRPLGAIPVT